MGRVRPDEVFPPDSQPFIRLQLNPLFSDQATKPRIAIIGGGISGLAAAHRIVELRPNCSITLLESSDRLGGILHTVIRDGYLLEQSADCFITSEPWAVDLCRRIGFDDELIHTNAAQRKAFVVRKGKLQPVPDGFTLMAPANTWPILTSPILSPKGKLRLAAERFVSRRTTTEDESLASFARRRLGKEAFERLVQPLIGGIYTANPERLSVQAAMPRFVEMERKFGSLTAGIRQSKNSAADSEAASGVRYSLFVTPRVGMSSLVEAITQKLPSGAVRLNSAVDCLVKLPNDRWRLVVRGEPTEREFDAVILATPAKVAGRILEKIDKDLANTLAGIEHASSAVVALAYRLERIDHPLNGFGFVVPAIEQRQILSASFSSIKFPGRSPAGRVLLRVFMGGALQSNLLNLNDDELKRIACTEIASLLGAHGEPEFSEVIRWNDAMPQYHVGHVELVQEVERSVAAWGTLRLAGNAYAGVGIPHCIRSGERAAEQIIAILSGTPNGLPRPVDQSMTA